MDYLSVYLYAESFKSFMEIRLNLDEINDWLIQKMVKKKSFFL